MADEEVAKGETRELGGDEAVVTPLGIARGGEDMAEDEAELGGDAAAEFRTVGDEETRRSSS